jgi:hypothetical protein
MKTRMHRLGLVFPLALVSIFTAVNASGATIFFDNLLANASFELGGGLGACPTSWTCGTDPGAGLVNSYAPTNVEYLAGADGLPGSKNAPDGSKVLSDPTGLSGSGYLYQTGLGTYAAGNTYALDLWVGTPMAVPSLITTAALPVGRITLYFLGTSVGGSLVQLGSVDVPPSVTPGQWTFHQFSFTPTGGAVGQSIGLELFVDGTPAGGGDGNNHIANFDIAAAVPEPGTVGLLGLALLGLVALRGVRPIIAR